MTSTEYGNKLNPTEVVCSISNNNSRYLSLVLWRKLNLNR